MKTSDTYGVFVGRLNPIHAGHQSAIAQMIADCGVERSLVVIGSSNAPTSLRHFFSYRARRELVAILFPQVRIVGLPDYHNDADWFLALDDLIRVAGMDVSKVVFYGGSTEDLRFYIDDGRRVQIMNRFDGTTVKTSATEVRDALIHGRSLDGLVDPAILPALQAEFERQWDVFTKL